VVWAGAPQTNIGDVPRHLDHSRHRPRISDAGRHSHCYLYRLSVPDTRSLTRFRLNYIGPMSERPRYHADDRSRDVLALDTRDVQIEDARSRAKAPSLEEEGFALIPHRSAVRDFNNSAEIDRLYGLEIERLLLDLTGADEVVLCAQPVRRTAETSRLSISGKLYNARPADFVHVDISNATAAAMAERRRSKRFAHYNLWRVFSPPPQNMPLAVCDLRTVSPSDLVEADAIMDIPGKKESSYVGLVVRYNPRHRWSYFSNMNRDELLVFKSEVPHAAFKNTPCPPRASIEMRAIAYWNL